MRRIVGSLLLLFAAGCSQSAPPVEFVLPVGFSGPIWIVDDATGGKPIPLEGGRHVVEVPPDGVLKAASLAPLKGWHSESARDTSGVALIRDHADTIPADAVGLRGGGYTVRTGTKRSVAYLSYYVGTKAQADRFFESMTSPPGFPTD